ncbi:hypothetical protein LRP88_07361 [Fusarium phalaenopsidis]
MEKGGSGLSGVAGDSVASREDQSHTASQTIRIRGVSAVPFLTPRLPEISESSLIQSETASSRFDDVGVPLNRQPEQLPVAQEQLLVNAKDIYAGLVALESKCIITRHDAVLAPSAGSKVQAKQWQALISLHETLLGEYLDFFLAIHDPLVGRAMRQLVSKYAMPARVWRHGIHSLLELMRQHLSDSLEYLLGYLNFAFGMVALFYETIPALKDTWAECLGDLARYRMALRVREDVYSGIWRGIARYWYRRALSKSPKTGRLYHHLAIVSSRNSVQQLFYFIKSLRVPNPFPGATQGTTRPFAFPSGAGQAVSRAASIEDCFVTIQGIIWFGGPRQRLQDYMECFLASLSDYINLRPDCWLATGHFIGAALTCALLQPKAREDLQAGAGSCPGIAQTTVNSADSPYTMPEEMVSQSLNFTMRVFQAVLYQCANFDTLSFLHTILAFLAYAAQSPAAMSYIGGATPWHLVVTMMNHLIICIEVVEGDYEVTHQFPAHPPARPLPEDFVMRGLPYAEGYFPSGWFESMAVDEEEKSLELPWMVMIRAKRILWVGCKIAVSGDWILWNDITRRFSVSRNYQKDSSVPRRFSSYE